MTASLPIFRTLFRSNDAVLALSIIVILALMIVPLPPVALDLLIAFNFALSAGIILIAMYIHEPLEFSVFPSVLLLVTLLRLGLNVAASRLILLNAEAGKVVSTFGNFLVGGNYVVGVVVFLTLMIIQFVVITNGAGRVAEVSARFTLDAMPGKQLAIDADLNAGMITEADARKRRRAIELEADFYGAMDGASKFVRGDAIAAVAIVVVNIIGGFLVGMFQLKLTLMQALQTYTLLTVGSGMVVQIPALLVSTAAGLIVTRSSSDESLGTDVISQLANPQALSVVTVMALAMVLIPGLPPFPFLLIGGATGSAAYFLWKRKQELARLPPPAAAAAPTESPDDVSSLLGVDPIEIEIGYGLIPLVGEDKAENLLRRVTAIRRQMATELGVVLPKVRIRDNLTLASQAYRIRVRGDEVAKGEVLLDHLLAIGSSDSDGKLLGVKTTEPAFGLPAVWITESQRAQAELLSCTIVDPISVITTHLTEIIRAYVGALLGRQQVQELLERVKKESPAAVDGLIPELMTLGETQDVLRNLLRERLPVRDLPIILEVLANNARLTRDPDVLSEAVRQSLARTITNMNRHDDGKLHVFTLAPALEAQLKGSLAPTERGLGLQVDASTAQQLVRKTGEEMEKMATQGYQPILLCAREVRLAFRRFVERVLPNLVVIAFSEVTSGVPVQAHGVVDV